MAESISCGRDTSDELLSKQPEMLRTCQASGNHGPRAEAGTGRAEPAQQPQLLTSTQPAPGCSLLTLLRPRCPSESMCTPGNSGGGAPTGSRPFPSSLASSVIWGYSPTEDCPQIGPSSEPLCGGFPPQGSGLSRHCSPGLSHSQEPPSPQASLCQEGGCCAPEPGSLPS